MDLFVIPARIDQPCRTVHIHHIADLGPLGEAFLRGALEPCHLGEVSDDLLVAWEQPFPADDAVPNYRLIALARALGVTDLDDAAGDAIVTGFDRGTGTATVPVRVAAELLDAMTEVTAA